MKVVGIIAEYNPFHLGHEYQIRYAKEVLGADYVIIAMSGDFVQRGTPALLEKHVRTRMALTGGADLVLELPVMWATASAEAFAKGGVELLDSLQVVDELCFGSECGSADDFMASAKILVEEPETYRKTLQEELKNGRSFPAARAYAVRNYFRQSDSICRLLDSPNAILGIEYCKAILRLASPVRPVPILRKGGAYNKTTLHPSELPSAKAIRQYIQRQSEITVSQTGPSHSAQQNQNTVTVPDLHFWMNPVSEKLLEENLIAHRCLWEDCLDAPLHYALLSAIHRNDLTDHPDMTPELANRIRNTICQYQSFSQYVSLLKTKEITRTHIQRALLHVYLDLKTLPDEIPYARILGFRRSSGELLGKIRQHSRIPLISKPADAEGFLPSDALKIFRTDVFSSNLYESLLLSTQPPSERHFVHEYQKPLVLVPR